uniref:Uncharacterized protein n=1 Tax=viral metagenome TaxID=1070528 RepID=A0A6C0H4L7_9ZZZZ
MKKIFKGEKDLFNLVIYILNQYKNKESNILSSNHKFYKIRHVKNIFSPYDSYYDINCQFMFDKDFSKLLLIETKLNIQDVAVIFDLCKILYNDGNDHYLVSSICTLFKSILDYENISYEDIHDNIYIDHSEYHNLSDIIEKNNINYFDIKYANIYINLFKSYYDDHKYEECFDTEGYFIYSIQDIIDLFE